MGILCDYFKQLLPHISNRRIRIQTILFLFIFGYVCLNRMRRINASMQLSRQMKCLATVSIECAKAKICDCSCVWLVGFLVEIRFY